MRGERMPFPPPLPPKAVFEELAAAPPPTTVEDHVRWVSDSCRTTC